MVSLNQRLDTELLETRASEFVIYVDDIGEDIYDYPKEATEYQDSLYIRAPIVTVMVMIMEDNLS